ncbi:hypothetical protein D3C77_758610 [compost metagenome]
MLALSGLLTGEPVELSESITADMAQFLELLAKEEIDFKQQNLKGDLAGVIGRIGETFGLSRETA